MSTTSTLRQHSPKSGTINSIKRNCIALINRFNNYFIKSYYHRQRNPKTTDLMTDRYGTDRQTKWLAIRCVISILDR